MKTRNQKTFSLSLIIIAALTLLVMVILLTKQNESTDNRSKATGSGTIQQLAAPLGIEIGSTGTGGFITTIPQYANLLKQEYNLLVSDYELHWGNGMRPDKTTFNFAPFEEQIAFAQANGMKVQGHHLVWGNKGLLPAWLKDANYSRSELLTILRDHITKTVSHYKGEVAEWVVINEWQGTPWDGSFWYEKMGTKTDWIESAFRTANQADPQAKLILNDTGIEFPNDPYYGPKRYNDVYNLVKTLKSKKIPIHGVGFQMHLNAKDFATEQVITQKMKELADNIARYKKLGVSVYVTEFDVRMDQVPGTQEEKDALQAKIYGAVLTTFLQAGMKSFATFGVTDELSWYKDMGFPEAAATAFRNYQPKPAYFALQQAFIDRLPKPTPTPSPECNKSYTVKAPGFVPIKQTSELNKTFTPPTIAQAQFYKVAANFKDNQGNFEVKMTTSLSDSTSPTKLNNYNCASRTNDYKDVCSKDTTGDYTIPNYLEVPDKSITSVNLDFHRFKSDTKNLEVNDVSFTYYLRCN